MKKILFMLSVVAIGALVVAQSSTPFVPPWTGYTGVTSSVATICNAIQPYKKIVTRVTQSSTSAPVDTTLEDNQSTAHSWTRLGAGNYRVKCSSCFSTTKTLVLFGNPVANTVIRAWVISVDSIGIQTWDTLATASDSKLTNTPLEIRMYP